MDGWGVTAAGALLAGTITGAGAAVDWILTFEPSLAARLLVETRPRPAVRRWWRLLGPQAPVINVPLAGDVIRRHTIMGQADNSFTPTAAWATSGRSGGPALGAGGLQIASLHIRRATNGTPATHPLSGHEMRELRRHQRGSPQSPFVFVSERGAPLSAPGFSRMVERAATAADPGIKAHAQMLRHACGYKLANDGHDTRAIQAYLGHRNIQNTTRYTALAPAAV
jgi:hypothetical protein